MENNTSLVQLFKVYAEQSEPPIIELQDCNHKPIGALYLKTLRYDKLAISETNNTEKYFLYIDGIGIYFSFYKKVKG